MRQYSQILNREDVARIERIIRQEQAGPGKFSLKRCAQRARISESTIKQFMSPSGYSMKKIKLMEEKERKLEIVRKWMQEENPCTSKEMAEKLGTSDSYLANLKREILDRKIR
jgi:AraC-like DNA-binding protein